jgi:hypothetical protein
MAQLVETGQLTLHDIRHLENTLAELEANKTAKTEGDPRKKKFPQGAKRRRGSAK